MNEVVKVVDHVANQPDRYMFVGILIVLMLFVYIVLQDQKKLIATLQDECAKDRELYRESIEGIANKYHEVTSEMKDEMRKNTSMLERLLEHRR